MNARRNTLALFAVAACLSYCSDRGPQLSTAPFDRALEESVALFTEYHLPNSMARPPAFDLESHLASIDQQRKSVTRIFHSPEGVAYLSERIDSKQDEMSVLAILEILHESDQPEAAAVFKKYAHHGSPVVSEWASRYLAMFNEATANDG